MGQSNDFLQQYKSPKWQKKRLEIMQRDKYTCQCCGEKEKMLNVHHKEYISGKKVWEYENDNFITLCENCHERRHTLIKRITKHLHNITDNNLESIDFILEHIVVDDDNKFLDNLAFACNGNFIDSIKILLSQNYTIEMNDIEIVALNNRLLKLENK